MKQCTQKDSNFYFNGKNAVDWFNEQITERRKKYKFQKDSINIEYKCIADKLKENGFVYLPQILDKDLLYKIRDNANSVIDEGKNLKINNEHFAFISQPLVNVEGLNELAFSDLFIGIAEAFFECKPAIGTLSLRRSKLNDLSPRDTQLFHCDKNSIKFFKFFVYLNDVDEIDHGPFTFVKGTNKKKNLDWNKKHRWSDEEIIHAYGRENIQHCMGKVGDLWIATTTAFHKGSKAQTKSRLALVINYVVHPELGGGKPKEIIFEVSKDFVNFLSEFKKPVADFLIKV